MSLRKKKKKIKSSTYPSAVTLDSEAFLGSNSNAYFSQCLNVTTSNLRSIGTFIKIHAM